MRRQHWLACRLESVSTVLANSNLDDPLENAEQLADQMESLPYIFRFEYEDMNTYFCSIMDPIVTAYSRGIVPGMACHRNPLVSHLPLTATFVLVCNTDLV